MTPWTIYLITRADAVHAALAFALVLGFVAFGLAPLVLLAVDEFTDIEAERAKRFLCRFYKCLGIAMVIACFLKVTLPTTKEMIAIIVLPKIAANQDIQALGSELPKIAGEWLEELRSEKGGRN